MIVNDKTMPYSHTAKYLDMTLDAKLRWKVHVKKKTGKAWPKLQTHVLANEKKIGPVDT